MSVEALKKFAVEHYEDGGHWVVETFSTDDWEWWLANSNSLEAAKVSLQGHWEFMVEREADCSFEY
jgi:hypothetical protein